MNIKKDGIMMKKIAIVYWSGTGNTEIMVQCIAEGTKEARAEAEVMESEDFSMEKVGAYDVVALGCSSQGSEQLEEYSFEPMFAAVLARIGLTGGAFPDIMRVSSCKLTFDIRWEETNMKRVFRVALIVFLCAAALSRAIALPVSAETEDDAIFIDGKQVSGYVAISGGVHMVTAHSDAETVCVAVYEDGQFKTVSFSRILQYDFPSSGAEIALFCLDAVFRPLREAVRVRQGAKLVYSGQAVCYDLYNDDGDFEDYTVKLKVVTDDEKIVEIRDIAGYQLNAEKPTNDVNANFLEKAAKALPGVIITKQSANITDADAVTGATCSSDAIARAVRDALTHTPEPYDDSGEADTSPVADGVYAGSSHCLSGYMNYMVDLDVTVKDGVVTEISDRTLKTPMSSNDKLLYSVAWRNVSKGIAKANMKADAFQSVDGVTGATVSTAGINAAVRNALQTRSVATAEAGDMYAPEGISLYARAYPVVTVQNGKISNIRIVPAKNTDTEQLEAFAGEIVAKQSVTGLTWPDDDAFSIANLTEQILYGTGGLK